MASMSVDELLQESTYRIIAIHGISPLFAEDVVDRLQKDGYPAQRLDGPLLSGLPSQLSASDFDRDDLSLKTAMIQCHTTLSAAFGHEPDLIFFDYSNQAAVRLLHASAAEIVERKLKQTKIVGLLQPDYDMLSRSIKVGRATRIYFDRFNELTDRLFRSKCDGFLLVQTAYETVGHLLRRASAYPPTDSLLESMRGDIRRVYRQIRLDKLRALGTPGEGLLREFEMRVQYAHRVLYGSDIELPEIDQREAERRRELPRYRGN